MAYWGQALVLGPNINAPMEPKDGMPALELVRKAASLGEKDPRASARLLAALEKRYSGNAERRKANDKAYADAMREVHRRFPADPDIAMLYVESVMDLNSWGYWMRDGYPMEGTAEIVAITEEVMRGHPRHPGAPHMYIHLIDATATPERAEKAADTLLTLMPDAGHILHMLSHIYLRVGRYADAIKSNQKAVAADEAYLERKHAKGLYPVVYFPHNIHFLGGCDGRGSKPCCHRVGAQGREHSRRPDACGITANGGVSRRAVLGVSAVREMERDSPGSCPIRGQRVREAPALCARTGFCRDAAVTAGGAGAGSAARHHEGCIADHPLMSLNTARAVLAIGPEVLAGEIAAARGQSETAISHLERAVRLEDALAYTEPPEWHPPKADTWCHPA